MSERLDLGDVLADLREEAAILRANGHGPQAATLERACERVQDACPDYLRWLTEGEAALRSGRAERWLSARFPEWEAMGHAKLVKRTRYYRAIIVPAAPLTAIERDKGRAA